MWSWCRWCTTDRALGLCGSMRQFLIEVFRHRFVKERAFELGVEIRVECGRVERARAFRAASSTWTKAWKLGSVRCGRRCQAWLKHGDEQGQ